MKRKRLASVMGIMAVFLSYFLLQSGYGVDTETALKPFLGQWEGQWKFTYGGSKDFTRPCKLKIYVENGQGYVDMNLGAVQSSGHAHGAALLSEEQNKLKAEIEDVSGAPYLVFTSAKGYGYRWFIKDGKLLGEPTRANAGEGTGTLSKVK